MTIDYNKYKLTRLYELSSELSHKHKLIDLLADEITEIEKEIEQLHNIDFDPQDHYIDLQIKRTKEEEAI